MDTDKLFSELADLGVCSSGRRLWGRSNKDVDMIIKVWKRWPEYFMEHSTPALEIVRRYFASEQDLKKLEDNRIFLDRQINAELGSEDYVFVIGDSSGVIKIKDWATVKLYCFNNASINMECGLHSYVNVECYDRSGLSVLSNNGTCTVYAYDDSFIDTSCELVRVIRKDLIRGQVFNGEEIY